MKTKLNFGNLEWSIKEEDIPGIAEGVNPEKLILSVPDSGKGIHISGSPNNASWYEWKAKLPGDKNYSPMLALFDETDNCIFDVGNKEIPRLIRKVFGRRKNKYTIVRIGDTFRFYFNGIRICKQTCRNLGKTLYPVIGISSVNDIPSNNDNTKLIIYTFKYMQ